MPKCIHCRTFFEEDKGSKEHAILSALGGKKYSRNICCESCNNRLGSEIDKPFATSLSFLSTILEITTGRNKDAPVHKKFVKHEGEYYDLYPGGKFKLSQANIKFEAENIENQESISITASNKEQTLKKLDQGLGKWQKSINDLPELTATHTKSYLPPVSGELSLGGVTQFRAVAKMLLTYLATMINPERLRNGQFNQVIEYIDKGNKNYNSCFWDFVSPVPSQPRISEINHRIFIFASEEKKVVFGVLELFSYLIFSAILTDTWDGGDLNKVYVIDPTTGEKEELEIAAPSNVFDFTDQRLSKENFVNQVYKAKDEILKIAHRRQVDKIISDITKKAINNDITNKNTIITQGMLDSFIEEISLEFTKFICRISSSEIIDLKE